MSHSTGYRRFHGSVKSYMTGFILSIILTVIPFWMVMSGCFSRCDSGHRSGHRGGADLVHLVYFLHMNTQVR
jgi:cytochrome o ubiquinol oxidase operon protein cyoD